MTDSKMQIDSKKDEKKEEKVAEVDEVKEPINDKFYGK